MGRRRPAYNRHFPQRMKMGCEVLREVKKSSWVNSRQAVGSNQSWYWLPYDDHHDRFYYEIKTCHLLSKTFNFIIR